jgi:hypothetical protein
MRAITTVKVFAMFFFFLHNMFYLHELFVQSTDSRKSLCKEYYFCGL